MVTPSITKLIVKYLLGLHILIAGIVSGIVTKMFYGAAWVADKAYDLKDSIACQ
jgi:hypothetical protein